MTAITGRIGVTRRPGELGIHSMDTFNLVVPDLKQAEEWLYRLDRGSAHAHRILLDDSHHVAGVDALDRLRR